MNRYSYVAEFKKPYCMNTDLIFFVEDMIISGDQCTGEDWGLIDLQWNLFEGLKFDSKSSDI
jgi:hypothetical protein